MSTLHITAHRPTRNKIADQAVGERPASDRLEHAVLDSARFNFAKN
jgi:hypothetical protein